jgi:micrococcal nuclease
MKQKITIILLLTALTCFGETTKVTRIIDGDTFEVESGEIVRLIGINAPEISDIFGHEAKKYLSSLIENKVVFLEIDNISKDRDRFQRLLRYVLLDDIDINKKMVSDGFAFAYLKYNFTKSSDYANAQIEARENNRGIWGDSKRETIINEQQKRNSSVFQVISTKSFFILVLVLILLFIGLLTYLKK